MYLFGEYVQPITVSLVETSKNHGEVFSFQALRMTDFLKMHFTSGD